MVGAAGAFSLITPPLVASGNPARAAPASASDTLPPLLAHTQQIRRQMEFHIFGRGYGAIVHPLVCGFETDEESSPLHGNDGASLTCRRLE